MGINRARARISGLSVELEGPPSAVFGSFVVFCGSSALGSFAESWASTAASANAGSLAAIDAGESSGRRISAVTGARPDSGRTESAAARWSAAGGRGVGSIAVDGAASGRTIGAAKKKAVGRDYIGKRGEAIAMADLLDFCGNPEPYFDPHFLGEKCPTYDFLVELLGAGPSPPYFLAQVKSTKQGFTMGTIGLKIALKAADVQKMVRCPIPTYLIGIDEPAARSYIASIHGTLSGRITTIPSTYPLDSNNLKVLWDEVVVYWTTFGQTSGSKTSAFVI